MNSVTDIMNIISIWSQGGAEITVTYEALKTVLRGYSPGDEVELTIIRNDTERTITVKLDPADENSPNNQH